MNGISFDPKYETGGSLAEIITKIQEKAFNSGSVKALVSVTFLLNVSQVVKQNKPLPGLPKLHRQRLLYSIKIY